MPRSARYLGFHLMASDSNEADMKHRFAQVDGGWCAMGALWRNKRIAVKLKAMVFSSLVRNALLSAAEVHVFTKTELIRMERYQSRRLR